MPLSGMVRSRDQSSYSTPENLVRDSAGMFVIRLTGRASVLLAAILTVASCTGITARVINPVSGVEITIQSTPGSAAGGNIQLAPASTADRPTVSPASIVAKCGQKFACIDQLRPTEITLAHVTEATDQLRDRLAWLVRWDVSANHCPPATGPGPVLPGQPTPPRYVPTSCTWWMVVDAKSGVWFGSWAVG